VPNVSIALPDPWIAVDIADLTGDGLDALADDAGPVRELLAATVAQLAERQVGFLALRVMATEDGLVPTGLITLTLDQSDAADLVEIEQRVRDELAEVSVRTLGPVEHVVGVTTDAAERSFVRGDFRLVGDDLLLSVWSTITALDDLAVEHTILDAIVGNLELTDLQDSN
jgi:hypothetical protein